MADSCAVTAKAGPGASKGYQMAAGARISGKLENIESNLDEDMKTAASHCFRSAIEEHKMSIGDAVNKVQTEVLKNLPNVRNKFFIRFDYGSNVVEIGVNKFANGNAQPFHSIGAKKMTCGDPFKII